MIEILIFNSLYNFLQIFYRLYNLDFSLFHGIHYYSSTQRSLFQKYCLHFVLVLKSVYFLSLGDCFNFNTIKNLSVSFLTYHVIVIFDFEERVLFCYPDLVQALTPPTELLCLFANSLQQSDSLLFFWCKCINIMHIVKLL